MCVRVRRWWRWWWLLLRAGRCALRSANVVDLPRNVALRWRTAWVRDACRGRFVALREDSTTDAWAVERALLVDTKVLVDVIEADDETEPPPPLSLDENEEEEVEKEEGDPPPRRPSAAAVRLCGDGDR